MKRATFIIISLSRKGHLLVLEKTKRMFNDQLRFRLTNLFTPTLPRTARYERVRLSLATLHVVIKTFFPPLPNAFLLDMSAVRNDFD